MIKEYKSMADLPETFKSSLIPQTVTDLFFEYVIKNKCVVRMADGKDERYVYILAIHKKYRQVACISINGDSLILIYSRAHKTFEIVDRKHAKVLAQLMRGWSQNDNAEEDED